MKQRRRAMRIFHVSHMLDEIQSNIATPSWYHGIDLSCGRQGTLSCMILCCNWRLQPRLVGSTRRKLTRFTIAETQNSHTKLQHMEWVGYRCLRFHAAGTLSETMTLTATERCSTGTTKTPPKKHVLCAIHWLEVRDGDTRHHLSTN